MYYAISFIIIYFTYRVRKRLFIYFLLNKGDVSFKDTPGERVFVDHEYGVSSRPDRIATYRNKKYVIEYKSRKKGIFEKDVIQAYVGALACWDHFGGIDFVVVYNSSYKYKLIKLRGKKGLYSKVKKHVDNARRIKKGERVRARVSRYKCRVCPYKKSCKWAR